MSPGIPRTINAGQKTTPLGMRPDSWSHGVAANCAQ